MEDIQALKKVISDLYNENDKLLEKISSLENEKAKVIRLCEGIATISPIWDMAYKIYKCPFCLQEISDDWKEQFAMEEIKHFPNCEYAFSKQLLKELKG